MDCAECGASLPAEARFCAVCGARQPDEEPLAVAEYQEALRELGPIDEAWARDELRALRGELRIREATHDRLLAELTRPALPVSAWVDAATMRDFRVGEQCLVRVRVVNEGRRALKRVVLRWRTSATEGEQEALAGVLGPGRDAVLGLLLRPRLAGHHQLGATLTVAGLRGPERSFAVAEVSFRVAGQGALQQSIHIDARSQRVGIFENIGSQPTGGLVDEGRWRRVELVPVDESDPEPDAEPLREGLRAPGVVTAVGEVIEVEVEGRRGLLVEVEDPALRAVLAPGDRLQVTVIGTDARGQALLSTRPPAGREPDAGRTAGASVTRSTDPGSGGGRPPAASVTEVVADLAEALRTAPPGARLVVRGRHRGPLTISQPVELRGEEAILEAERGPVLLVQADAVLRGLVVRGTARPGAYAADAVEVRSGRVSLHECDLRSDASGNLTPGRAVAVTGPATVELRGCRIHHSGVGVAVDVSWGGFATTTARGARVGLQDCRIVDNALGVAVAGAGREVRAVGCTFSGNADAAVRALPGATAVVEDSEVDRASLIADPGATLDARGNRS